MKKNIYCIFLGLAAIALFASCEKNEITEITDPVIANGKIQFTAATNKMQQDPSEAKYSFNAAGNSSDPNPNIFFNSSDSVYINGRPYAVFPYSFEYPETDEASAHAHIWADIDSTGVYKGLFPKSAFTDISDVDHPVLMMPDTMHAFPTDLYYVGSIFEINPARDGRVMPMTAYVTHEHITDMLRFKNTMGMFLLSLRYNFPFGACIDPQSTSELGYPYVEVTRVEITTPYVPLNGVGTITNPYGDSPYVTIGANGGHTMIYTIDSTVGILPTQRGAQDLLFLPIVPFPTTRATVNIYFTTHSLVSGTTHKYKYSKTVNNKLHAERGQYNNLIVNFSTAADYNTYCTLLE